MGTGLWPYLFIAVAGYLANDLWRWLGVLTATRIDEDSEILRWVRAVSTALVAGLVARLIIFPVGAMEIAPLAARLGAVAVGLGAYFTIGRNVLVGILAGEAVLVAATMLVSGGF